VEVGGLVTASMTVLLIGGEDGQRAGLEAWEMACCVLAGLVLETRSVVAMLLGVINCRCDGGGINDCNDDCGVDPW